MKKTSNIVVAVLILGLITPVAQALVIEDEYDYDPMEWYFFQSGHPGIFLGRSTEDVMSGTYSLKLIDGANGSAAQRIETLDAGDLTAVSTGYLEVSFKTPSYTGTDDWLQDVQVHIGNTITHWTGWSLASEHLRDTADANGWYLLHLELDLNGDATVDGATLNGSPVTLGGAWTHNDNPVDWTNIQFLEVSIYERGPYWTNSNTYYLDRISLDTVVQPLVIEDEYDYDPMEWYFFQSGHPGIFLGRSTEDVMSGTYSLKLIDGANGSAAQRIETLDAGNLIAASTGYLEVSFKTPSYTGSDDWLQDVQVHIGNTITHWTGWSLASEHLRDTADPNGWYLLHLELDPNADATVDGATLNGSPVTLDSAWTYNDNPVDWTNIQFLEVSIYERGPYWTYSNTYYLDKISMNAIYEPTCGEAIEDSYGLLADINKDCYVNIIDLQMFLSDWLRCFDQVDASCERPWEEQ